MRIGRRFMACVSLVLIFTSGNALLAQQADTFNTKIFKPFWTQQRFVPKIGAGVQDRGFFEIGVQWHNIFWHPLSLASKGPYATVDIFMDNEDVVLYGPKLGYELTAGMLGVAFDVTYFIDRNDHHENRNTKAFVGTPKAGLTILGFVDLYYGYQIPFSKEKIDWINPNRFSITFNLNRDYFDLKDARRRQFK